MPISTTDLKKLIASVKAAIPDLEQIVTAREAAEDAQTVLSHLRTELAGLDSERTRVKALVESEKQGADKAVAKIRENLGKAEASYHARIEDMQRKVNDMQALVDKGQAKLEEQRQGHAIAEENHKGIIAQIEAKARQAEQRAEAAKAKLQELHGHLTGLTQAP